MYLSSAALRQERGHARSPSSAHLVRCPGTFHGARSRQARCPAHHRCAHEAVCRRGLGTRSGMWCLRLFSAAKFREPLGDRDFRRNRCCHLRHAGTHSRPFCPHPGELMVPCLFSYSSPPSFSIFGQGLLCNCSFA